MIKKGLKMSLQVSGKVSCENKHVLPHLPKCHGLPIYDPRLVLAAKLVEAGDFNDKIVKICNKVFKEKQPDITPLTIEELESSFPNLRVRLGSAIIYSMFDSFLYDYKVEPTKDMLKELETYGYVLSPMLLADVNRCYKDRIKPNVIREVLKIYDERQKL